MVYFVNWPMIGFSFIKGKDKLHEYSRFHVIIACINIAMYVISVKLIVSEICITGRYLLQIVAPSLASYVCQ